MIRDEFATDGFVVVRNAVPAADLDEVTADLAGVFGRRARAIGLDVPDPVGHAGFSSLLVRLFDHDRASYLASARQTQYLGSVQRLGLSAAMMRVLRELGLSVPAISTRPVIHYMADRLKIDGGYHKTPVHQDWRSVQGSLDGITFWLPLFDVGPNDYPLEIVRGSHRRGLLPSAEDAFGHRVSDGQVGAAEFEPVFLRRGDAVFFSGFLVHRTGDSGGDAVRIAFSFRYNNAADPSFIARNYPSPYTYKADMRLMQADFPTAADVAQVFDGPARAVS